jgi:flotillin
MILFFLFVIGAALAIGPWVFQEYLSFGAVVTLSAIGCIVLLIVSVASIITRLYRKASANLSFVRTGMGGVKVIQDGGAIVVPVIHQVIPVSMETMRLNVERRGAHALITKDNLRVDLSAEFYSGQRRRHPPGRPLAGFAQR